MHLYHWVPKNLEGSVLYPLNELRTHYPHLYEEQIAKYAIRPRVIEQRIPPFDCLWNDVLFLSPVHPAIMRTAWEEAGIKLKPFESYEIDPHLLNPAHATVWVHEDDAGNPEEYRVYDPNDLQQYSVLTEKARNYYRGPFPEGRRPLLFRFVPHILYRAPLDISNNRVRTIES